MVDYRGILGMGFKLQNFLYNCSHDLTILSLNLSIIAIMTVESLDYGCIIHDISKYDAIGKFSA